MGGTYDQKGDGLHTAVLSLDILLTIVIFLFSFWARGWFAEEAAASFTSHLFLIPLLLVLVVGFLSYFGAYRSPASVNVLGYCWSIIRAMLLAVGILLSLLFFLEIQYVSRLVMFVFAATEFFGLLLVRIYAVIYYRQKIKTGKKMLRVMIIGSRDRAREMARELKRQSVWGVEIVGFVDPDPSYMGREVDGAKVIGTVDNICECLKENVVDEVIIAISRSLLVNVEPIVAACEEEGITLRFMADIFNVNVARFSLSQVGHIPLLTMETVAHDAGQLLLKRLFDIAVTLIALPLLLPIFLITAIAIKLDSPGPIFFIQERVGLRKHCFSMFKFRSMYIDAEERLREIEHLNEAEGPIFKMTNDPRITRVGRLIRKTSIDELPQLFNVLRGEMSLVGPRPMSIRDVNLFDKGIQRKRFSVKPGLTCIWQISGRSNLPFQKWLEMDLEYIDNWSLALDSKILVQTIPAVVKSDGAV